MKNLRPMSWKLRPVVALLVVAVAFLGARSSFQHRGVNPATVSYTHLFSRQVYAKCGLGVRQKVIL